MFAHRLIVPAIGLTLSATAIAQTSWVVDDNPGPGVDFTNLQTAIDTVSPGDRIDLRQGLYAPVTIAKPLTLMGEDVSVGASQTRVSQITVLGTLTPEIIVIADLSCNEIIARDSDGTLIIDGVNGGVVDVLRCADVRLQATRTDISRRFTKVDIVDSFAQLQGLEIQGFFAGGDEDGDPGLVCERSEVILTDCRIEGEAGGNQVICFGNPTPFGGPGLLAEDSAVRALGCQFVGGGPGIDCFGAPVFFTSGDGIEFVGNPSTVVMSESTISGAVTGTGTTDQRSGLPWVALASTGVPGAPAAFGFHAEADSVLRVYLGRVPRVLRLSFLDVPLLHTWDRGVPFDEVPPSGIETLDWTIPALPRGALVHVQSSRTLAAPGGTEVSNGVTLVVR